MSDYNNDVLAALNHIRRFLDYNKDETVTGYHDAIAQRNARRRAGRFDPETRDLDYLLTRVLNMAHEYADTRA